MNNQNGFALIALVIAIALLLALFAIFLKPGGEKDSVVKTGERAEEQLKENGDKMKNYQTEINNSMDVQNNLNSIQ